MSAESPAATGRAFEVVSGTGKHAWGQALCLELSSKHMIPVSRGTPWRLADNFWITEMGQVALQAPFSAILLWSAGIHLNRQ